jgi:hypothetical protein
MKRTVFGVALVFLASLAFAGGSYTNIPAGAAAYEPMQALFKEYEAHYCLAPEADRRAILEIRKMALLTLTLNAGAEALPEHMIRKHRERKHGPAAYYGQGAAAEN